MHVLHHHIYCLLWACIHVPWPRPRAGRSTLSYWTACSTRHKLVAIIQSAYICVWRFTPVRNNKLASLRIRILWRTTSLFINVVITVRACKYVNIANAITYQWRSYYVYLCTFMCTSEVEFSIMWAPGRALNQLKSGHGPSSSHQCWDSVSIYMCVIVDASWLQVRELASSSWLSSGLARPSYRQACAIALSPYRWRCCSYEICLLSWYH